MANCKSKAWRGFGVRGLAMSLGAAMALVGAGVASAQSPTPVAPAVRESECSLVVEADGKHRLVGPVAGFHVLDGPDQIVAPVTPGGRLIAITCVRSAVVPDDRDDRVARQLGVPLYLSRQDPDATLSLQKGPGGFSVRLLDGSWTNQEQQQVMQRIDLFNSRR